MEIILEQLSEMVRSKRQDLGLTQSQLAEQAGISRRLEAQVEAGEASGISLSKLTSLLSALGFELKVSPTRQLPLVPQQPAALDEALANHLARILMLNKTA